MNRMGIQIKEYMGDSGYGGRLCTGRIIQIFYICGPDSSIFQRENIQHSPHMLQMTIRYRVYSRALGSQRGTTSQSQCRRWLSTLPSTQTTALQHFFPKTSNTFKCSFLLPKSTSGGTVQGSVSLGWLPVSNRLPTCKNQSQLGFPK